MRSEIKVELNNKEVLNDLIQKAYFKDGQMGRLFGQKNFIEVTPEVDDVLHTVVKGLNNATIRIINHDLIDGTFRFIIHEDCGSIKIYPISMFCVIDENKKYSFY